MIVLKGIAPSFVVLASLLLFQVEAQKFPLDEQIPQDDYYYDEEPLPPVPKNPIRRVKIPSAEALATAALAPKSRKTPLRSDGPFECPEPFGYFEDPIQCDKYWTCDDFHPTEHLCEDGLVFDINKINQKRDPCDSPFNVDCGTRSELQPPSFDSEECPRKHGFFPPPDQTICNAYHTCIKGIDQGITKCAAELHFSPDTGTCTWPAIAGRKNCVKERPTLEGFSCPEGDTLDNNGQKIPHPTYPDTKDCQQFFTCLNGNIPQKGSCSLGQVFNELKRICDFPEYVPECKGWYRDDPSFADYYTYYDEHETNQQAENDPGKQDTVA